MPDKFYITTTTPYVNGEPHIGFAREIVVADVIARWRALMGDEVKFNTGADEHGQKVYEKAKELGKDPQTYTDELAPRFERLKSLLDLSFTNFTRTTDPHHKAAAQEFWRRCDKSGYIYKGKHKIKYCIGCELEKTDSELEDDKCPIHPNKELEIREEENYFFKFSAFAEPLLSLYAHNPNLVLPDFRFNEIKKFVGSGLQDFSISRLKEKMSWGVPVPGDDAHVMYVWFDALVNYISTLGWPEREDFGGFWPGVQVYGKDNLRQQTAMWQAMLMAAKLPNTKQFLTLGFITGDGGIKMSKSLGNVVDPESLTTEYGTDPLRYFLLRELSLWEDSPFTPERFKEAYNANLANGLGNLASRIMKMAETHLSGGVASLPQGQSSGPTADGSGGLAFDSEFTDLMSHYELSKAMDYIWKEIGRLDTLIQQSEPFKLVKADPAKGKELIAELVINLHAICQMLAPFLPATAEAIKTAIKANKSFTTPLFPRKD
ncbi:MAG TPA: methionine--tRNA ligase [Candidatus Paceibacterota bacterium]